MQATYVVPEANLSPLRERLEKLNKITRKLGLAEITLTAEWDHDEEYFRSQSDKDFGIVSIRRWHKATVTGDTPKVPGWTFVAAIEHTSDGNILSSMPGAGELPKSYREAGPTCDHCHTTRRRQTTFVIHSGADGFKQVGRQCLADFTGHNDPHGIASYAELLGAFEAMLSGASDDEGDCWGGGQADPQWELGRYLAITAAVIRTVGWTSRTVAREYGRGATADAVLDYLWGTGNDAQKFRDRVGKPTEQDQADAAATIEWVNGLEAASTDLNDYEYNLSVIVRAGRVNLKHVGLATSMVPSYYRHVQRELERKRKAEGLKAPLPQGRVVIEGVITKLDLHENDFGTREVMTVLADDGWKVWGTQPRELYGAHVGDRVRFTATIEPSQDRPEFGFFKRPTKATVLVEAAAAAA